MADDWHERDRLVEYSEDAQRGFRPLRKPDSTCSRLGTRCNVAVGLVCLSLALLAAGFGSGFLFGLYEASCLLLLVFV